MFQTHADSSIERDRKDQRLGGACLIAALVLGVLGDALFNGARLGINLPLWSGAALLAVLLVGRYAQTALDRRRVALLAASLLLTLVVAWRASATLEGLNLAGAGAMFGLAVGLAPGSGLKRIGLAAFVLAAASGMFAVCAGALRLDGGGLLARPRRRLQGQGAWIARGLGLSSVLVLVFGGLFVSADAVFQHLVTVAFRPDVELVGRHVSWTVFCAWVSAGLLWGCLGYRPVEALDFEVPESRRLRNGEMGLVLGSLTLIFAAFVAVQLRYLFGGEELVQRSIGLTYAQYARRGFFELVAVAALLVAVLLAVDWARGRTPAGSRLFRVLGLCLVMLLGVVMASAVQRMRVYQETYGLTELRLYVLAFLAALGIAVAWFVATVLRGKGVYFLSGCLAIALVGVAALDALNPDSTIASTNIDRAANGGRFDAAYLTRLGADAVPSIVARFESIPAAERCVVGRALIQRWSGSGDDLRSWNRGREKAKAAVEGNRQRLEEACAPGR